MMTMKRRVTIKSLSVESRVEVKAGIREVGEHGLGCRIFDPGSGLGDTALKRYLRKHRMKSSLLNS